MGSASSPEGLPAEPARALTAAPAPVAPPAEEPPPWDLEPADEKPAEEEPPPKPTLRERWQSFRDDWRAVDWEVVRSLAVREALTTIRSRAWTRLLVWVSGGVTLLAFLPLAYRAAAVHRPPLPGRTWLLMWTV